MSELRPCQIEFGYCVTHEVECRKVEYYECSGNLPRRALPSREDVLKIIRQHDYHGWMAGQTADAILALLEGK